MSKSWIPCHANENQIGSISFLFHSSSVWHRMLTMSAPIRFFTFIRDLYHRLGVHPPNPHVERSYNWRNSLVLVCLTILFVISTGFLIFECDTVAKFGASFYVSISVLLYLIFWTMIIHKIADLFILMGTVDEFVAKSKWISFNLFASHEEFKSISNFRFWQLC